MFDAADELGVDEGWADEVLEVVEGSDEATLLVEVWEEVLLEVVEGEIVVVGSSK